MPEPPVAGRCIEPAAGALHSVCEQQKDGAFMLLARGGLGNGFEVGQPLLKGATNQGSMLTTGPSSLPMKRSNPTDHRISVPDA